MKFKHIQEDNKGSFIATIDDKRAGEMTYSKAGDSLLIIDHTDVDGEFRGLGVGESILDELVAYVRENNIKVLPLCPFAASVFQKKEAIRDVLK